MQEGLKYQVYTKCFVCNNGHLKDVFDFGLVPMADYLVEQDKDYRVPSCPLHLVYCVDCGFLRIKECVHPEFLFNEDYPYFTSVNPALVSHFAGSFKAIQHKKQVIRGHVAIEAASNDGYMLSHFQQSGATVLGVEPSAGPALKAQQKGINTITDFFSSSLASRLHQEGWHADFFVGNNVLAHVENPNDFLQGVKILLKDNGLAVFEFPYKRRMFEKVEFDTIFHQHVSYYSLLDIVQLFSNNGLCVTDAEEIGVHGGSLRVYAGRVPAVSQNVEKILAEEKNMKLNGPEELDKFLSSIQHVREELRDFLTRLTQQGKSVCGYGAAGKANTLLSYCGVTATQLPFIVDISPYKQNKYFSTGHIPIRDVAYLQQNNPDYVLILAWNFAEDIIANLKQLLPASTRYVIPIPTIKELS